MFRCPAVCSRRRVRREDAVAAEEAADAAEESRAEPMMTVMSRLMWVWTLTFDL